MRYGTQKSPGPWRMTFTVRDEPRCPGCTEFLQPVVVEFRSGWAWCPVCIGHGLHFTPCITYVLGRDEMCSCTTIVNGLRFYTPEPVSGKFLTAYEWYEQLLADEDASGGRGLAPGRPASTPPVLRMPLPVVDDEPDGVYAITPSGEQLLADLDVSALLEVERDLKRVRSQH